MSDPKEGGVVRSGSGGSIIMGGCSLAGSGCGDCEHAVGLPGKSIPCQHDGPDDTLDVYGKPNGWCWYCWLVHERDRLAEELRLAKMIDPEQRTPKAGDVVRLKSGGPEMTVTNAKTTSGKVQCRWFRDFECCAVEFSLASLVVVNDEPGQGPTCGGIAMAGLRPRTPADVVRLEIESARNALKRQQASLEALMEGLSEAFTDYFDSKP